LQDDFQYNLQEKKDADRKKSQIAEMSRQSYLKQVADKQLSRFKLKEERLLNSQATPSSIDVSDK